MNPIAAALPSFLLLACSLIGQQPLDLGFEAGEPGSLPDPWALTSFSKNWRAELTDAKATNGKLSLTLAPTDDDCSSFGNVMQAIDAAPWRGHRVRLAARLQVTGTANAQMWLRVDRMDGRTGGFDNMHDRPVRPGDWREAVIQLDIAGDAKAIALGFFAFRGAQLFVDEVSLTAIGDAQPEQPASLPAALTPREQQNVVAATRLLGYLRFFHPSKAAVKFEAWDHFAIALIAAAGSADDARQLVARLTATVAPLAPTVQIWAGSVADAPPLLPQLEDARQLWSWEHHGAGRISKNEHNVYTSKVSKRWLTQPLTDAQYADCHVVVDLGDGVAARIPVEVLVSNKKNEPVATADAAWSTANLPLLTSRNRDTRLASVALAWTVLQHFYPYFDVVDTDWNAALTEALTSAATDVDDRAFLMTLKRLFARLHDGHGHVTNRMVFPHDYLPIAVTWANDELVVTGRAAGADEQVHLGDVVLDIDGTSAADCYRKLAATIPAATEGFRRYLSTRTFLTDLTTGDPVRLDLRRADGTTTTVTLPRSKQQPLDQRPPRPANGSSLADGIVYFDLQGAQTEAVDALMPTLVAAKGIVFDMRGYPGSAGKDLLEHLIRDDATSAFWEIPIIKRPDRVGIEWSESSWQMTPQQPHLDAKIAFLTDGQAVSYAESVMGIVEAYKLGEIVGATTAGTNGNINPFSLPDGYEVWWTGMRVLKHDRSTHHGVGIKPTVPVEPTAAGIAAGHDEVLEKAVQVLQKALAQ